MAGSLLEFFWWGSVFLLAIPVMVALLILGPRILPEYRDPNAGRLDLASAVMAVGAVLAVIFGLKQIAQEGLGLLAIAAVVVGLVVGGLWVRRQARLADPMIDLALFRVPTFNAALVVNFLAIFVAVGYFLFIAQYLQLVAGLTPFQAGLLSLPSAIAFIVGSQAAPRIVQRVKPAYLISGGLAFGSVGLFLLTQVGTTNGLLPLVIASVDHLARSGPGVRADDRAHRRLGAPRTRRGRVGDQRDGCRARRCARARAPRQHRRGDLSRRARSDRSWPAFRPMRRPRPGTRSAARSASRASCRPSSADALLAVARASFVDGMHVAAAIAGVIGLGLAAFAYVTLRERVTERSATEPACVEPTMMDQPVLNPLAKPARECF